jgi:hypothetical protein
MILNSPWYRLNPIPGGHGGERPRIEDHDDDLGDFISGDISENG